MKCSAYNFQYDNILIAQNDISLKSLMCADLVHFVTSMVKEDLTSSRLLEMFSSRQSINISLV